MHIMCHLINIKEKTIHKCTHTCTQTHVIMQTHAHTQPHTHTHTHLQTPTHMQSGQGIFYCRYNIVKLQCYKTDAVQFLHFAFQRLKHEGGPECCRELYVTIPVVHCDQQVPTQCKMSLQRYVQSCVCMRQPLSV
jgi:hypothetical protein